KNLSTPPLPGFLAPDLVPLRIPEGGNPTEALGADRGHVHASTREFAHRGVDVPHEELHVPAVAPGVRLALRVESDRTIPRAEVDEMGVLVGNRQAERFVIESSHPLEIADPDEGRLDLRIRHWTGHCLSRPVTTENCAG